MTKRSTFLYVTNLILESSEDMLEGGHIKACFALEQYLLTNKNIPIMEDVSKFLKWGRYFGKNIYQYILQFYETDVSAYLR